MVCYRKRHKSYIIQIISNNSLIDKVYSIKIDPGNYNGNDLANELTRKSTIVINDIPNASNFFTVTYSLKKYSSFDYQYSDYKFKVLTPDDLKQDYINRRFQNSYDKNNPKDINEVIVNLEGNSLLYQFPTGYEAMPLSMQSIRNIYIHSSMGNYNCIGPNWESTIMKKSQ